MGDTTAAGDRAMIGRSLPRVLDWYAARRRRQIERACRDAAALQERALLDVVSAARDTEFGLVHGLSGVRSVAEYQERVPVRDYGYFRPLWDRVIAGDADVAWPGRCRDWVATAATMGPAKLIPLTADSLRSHRRGGFDAVLLSVGRVGARGLAGGASLVLGGSPAARPLGGGCRLVDLSALAAQHLPAGLERLCAPAPDVAAIEDWDERLEAVAATAARHDLRLLWGMPARLLQVFERVARHRQAIGRPIRDLGQCWPHLSVLVHGGMGFTPYAAVFDEWLGRRLERVEIYAAAEAFVALQTEAAGLTLMPDYGVFYEFVPVEDLGSERPRRHTVADAELHRPYAVAVTTAAGLWSYLLGDTVRFTAREPLRLAVTGRTRHYVDVAGERVIVEEVERALVGACRRTEAEVVDFTVAPRDAADRRAGGHEWLVEFRVPPREPDDFARVLDETLRAMNPGYRSRRSGAGAIGAPTVTALPAGTFHRWMRAAGARGAPRQAPRATNDRTLANALAAAAPGGSGRWLERAGR